MNDLTNQANDCSFCKLSTIDPGPDWFRCCHPTMMEDQRGRKIVMPPGRLAPEWCPGMEVADA